MVVILFSQRHRDALENKTMSLSISKRIRRKMIHCMQKYNQWYGYNEEVSRFDVDLKCALLENYGDPSLKAYVKDVFREVDDIEQFILGCVPESVLDAIELYATLIDKRSEKDDFYKDCNHIFKIEDSPLRVLDGYVIKLDSAFLESEILHKAYELLKDNHFEKACKDFLNARQNLTAGDYSGTIIEANNAIESTLKKALNKEKGDQRDLKKWLMKSGIIPDYFQGFCDHFEGLLQSAFSIANESSRHGKKEIPNKKNEVNHPVASFLLHVAGSLIVFIMERYQDSIAEEDVPF